MEVATARSGGFGGGVEWSGVEWASDQWRPDQRLVVVAR